MNSIAQNLLLPTLIAVIAAASGLWMARNQQRRDSGDASEQMVNTALKLHTRLEEEVAKLNDENKEMEERLELMEDEMEVLTGQVRALARYTSSLIHQAMSHNLDPIVSMDELDEILGEDDGGA